MQATQSNNASDLLHPDTTDLSGAHADPVRAREQPSAFSTPIFLGPIQAARKYLERQRSGGSPAEDVRSGNRGASSDLARPGATSRPPGIVSSLYGRDLARRELGSGEQVSRERNNRDQERQEQDRREQDRRLERSLYEGHSLEAGLTFEDTARAEDASGTTSERAFFVDSDGTERLFPYAAPYLESTTMTGVAPNPEAVRGAIFRLASESRPVLDSVAGATVASQAVASAGQTDTPGTPHDHSAAPAPVAASAQIYTSPYPDFSVRSAYPGFADVARSVWTREAVEGGTLVAEEEDGHKAGQESGGAGREVVGPPPQTAVPQRPGLISTPSLSPAMEQVSTELAEVTAQMAPSLPLPQAAQTQSSDVQHSGRFEDAGLAHDACNLLSALGLYSDLLNTPGVLDEQHSGYAGELKLIALRSQSLINRLLRLRSLSDASLSLVSPRGEVQDGLNSGLSADTPEGTLNQPLPHFCAVERDRAKPNLPGAASYLAPALQDLPYTSRLHEGPLALAPNPMDAGDPFASQSVPIAPLPDLPHVGTAHLRTSPEAARPFADHGTLAAGSNQADGKANADAGPGIDLATLSAPVGHDLKDGQQQAQPRVEKVLQTAPWNEVGSALPRDLSLENTISAKYPPTATTSSIDRLEEGDAGPTSLVDLLMRWGSVLSTLAHGTLDISFGPQSATPVAVTAESLERILVNLVKNATAATIEGGAIRIGVGVSDAQARSIPIEGAEWEAGDHAGSNVAGAVCRSVVLTVDDSGCGMSEAQVQKILQAEAFQGTEAELGLDDTRKAEGMLRAGDVSRLREDEILSTAQSGHAATPRAVDRPGAYRLRALDEPIREEARGDPQFAGAGRLVSVSSPFSEADKAAVSFTPGGVQLPSDGGVSSQSKIGRGLGLRVVRGLVTASGGTLAVHSRLGRGTRIEVRWPSATSEALTAKQARATVQSAAILLESQIALEPLLNPVASIAVGTEQVAAIGPDGFSEAELRAMMLRLHRTSLPDQGEAQSLLDRRDFAPELPDRRQERSQQGVSPVANHLQPDAIPTDRIAPDRVRTKIYSATEGAIA